MSQTHKADIRTQVWTELRKVAFPDSRFHYDFAEFIADFQGSSDATALLLQLPAYKDAKVAFITPDNCLEELRFAALGAGKKVLVTTYAIRRGFWLLDPAVIAPERYEYASTLDGLERVGRHITLADMVDEKLMIDLMVTGTGAINMEGIRFGKGHGFFDLEWAMLHTIGAVTLETQTAAIVHDCQVLNEQLYPEEFDTVCDIVTTPTKIIEVMNAKKPKCGILWDKLAPGMLEDIEPLQELKMLLDNEARRRQELDEKSNGDV